MTPYTLHQGDCRDVMAGMDADRVDAIVCDPPYGLRFMGKGWDHGVPGVEFWQAAKRVAKPGAHLLAFGGTRTFHRLTVAIEDAGWEIRDTIMWVYGSGFPKSLDVSKAIDAAAGAEREVVGERPVTRDFSEAGGYGKGHKSRSAVVPITAPATGLARQWKGWGTALKPAWEPIIVARKPLAGTVAANVQRYGTGGLNVDACRIEAAERPNIVRHEKNGKFSGVFAQGSRADGTTVLGRWPANLIHDGSEDVVGLFPESDGSDQVRHNGAFQSFSKGAETARDSFGFADSGSAARFFQQCKGSTIESWIDLGIANIAETLSTQQRQVAASALALVASEALDVDGLSISVSLAPSTAATASEFATISASVTRTIQSIGSRFWHELEPLRLTLTSNLVEAAVTREPTGTTTITLSRWKSDGSAEPVTFSIMRPNSAHGEAASASRLIYTAKASREDREEGLESLPLRSAGEATDRVDGSAGLNSPRAEASRTNGARNHHPTVKPTSLMRYLCRLVTPRDGIVLDPFMGSGSTGKAAILEGFRFIGIDLEPEYVEIGRARCEWAMAQPRQLVLEDAS